jgi:hypothetical protein
VKSFFDAAAGFPPDAAAVAVLWTAAKVTGAPRPLEDLLKCSKADERRVRRTTWRLKEAMRSGRPSVEDYVKAPVAKVDLPASIVSLRWSFWRRTGVFWPVRIRGFGRRCGWRRSRSWGF